MLGFLCLCLPASHSISSPTFNLRIVSVHPFLAGRNLFSTMFDSSYPCLTLNIDFTQCKRKSEHPPLLLRRLLCPEDCLTASIYEQMNDLKHKEKYNRFKTRFFFIKVKKQAKYHSYMVTCIIFRI